jgi:hypothetical protein
VLAIIELTELSVVLISSWTGDLERNNNVVGSAVFFSVIPSIVEVGFDTRPSLLPGEMCGTVTFSIGAGIVGMFEGEAAVIGANLLGE